MVRKARVEINVGPAQGRPMEAPIRIFVAAVRSSSPVQEFDICRFVTHLAGTQFLVRGLPGLR